MATIEDFKALVGAEADGLTKDEIEQLFVIAPYFANFAFKKYSESMVDGSDVVVG